MRYIIVVLLMASCLYGVSPNLKYLGGIEVECLYNPQWPNPLCLPGGLYTYSVDELNYMRMGWFAIRTKAWDISGVPITDPVFEQKLTRIKNIKSNGGIDYIGKWSASDGMKRKGESEATLYAGSDGYCYAIFGCLMYSNSAIYTEDVYSEYNLSVTELASEPLLFATRYIRMVGFTFWHPYMGSAWSSVIGAENGVWVAWDDTLTENQITMSAASMPSGNQSGEAWPTDMRSIGISELNYESVNSLKSYTVSFDAVGGETISFFLVGKDINDCNVYTFCKAKKVGDRYVSDNFFPVRTKNNDIYLDPNSQITYRKAYTLTNLDISLIRLNNFAAEWLKSDSRYDIDGNGKVDFRDYAIIFGDN